MEPEAVAIRLGALKVGPKELQGKRPVVIFADQGLAGAAQDRAAIDAIDGELKAGGAFDGFVLPPRPVGPESRPGPTQTHQLDRLVIILDRSGSMATPVAFDDRAPKIDHIKGAIDRLGQDCFPETQLSLITFNHEAVQVPLSSGGTITELQQAISALDADGGTCFENAFKLAEALISKGPDGSQPGRNAIIFVTDGQDGGRREQAAELAAAIRGRNTGTFLVGVGADYELANLVQLAKKFAFSGWAHTPIPGDQNVFQLLIPAFLNDLQSAEHYLKVTAASCAAGFHGLTPAIREADDGVFFVGYQNQGIGICFVAEGDDPQLKLEITAFESDPTAIRREIPIIDYEDAAAFFEKRELAKGAIGPLLVLKAQLEGDVPLLEQLWEEYPELQDAIDGMLNTMEQQQHDAQARMATLSSMSQMGTMTGTHSVIWAQRGQGKGAAPHLHSGGLGPLSLPFTGELPPMGKIDPAAYQDVVPAGHAKFVFDGSSGYKEIDLHAIPDGGAIAIGRGASCGIQLGDLRVGRRHLSVRRDDTEFYVSDLNSANGSFLNGTRIEQETKLADGDELQVGGVRFTFRS